MCENEYLIKACENTQIRCIQQSSTLFATCIFLNVWPIFSHRLTTCVISFTVSSTVCHQRMLHLPLASLYVASSTLCQRVPHLLLYSTCVATSFFSLQRILHLLAFSQCIIFFFQSAFVKSSNLSVCVSLFLLLHDVRCIVFSKYKCVASYTCTPSTHDDKRETDAVAIVLRVWKYT